MFRLLERGIFWFSIGLFMFLAIGSSIVGIILCYLVGGVALADEFTAKVEKISSP